MTPLRTNLPWAAGLIALLGWSAAAAAPEPVRPTLYLPFGGWMPAPKAWCNGTGSSICMDSATGTTNPGDVGGPIGAGNTRAIYQVVCQSTGGRTGYVWYASEPIGDANDMPGATTYDRAIAKALSVGGVALPLTWQWDGPGKTCDYQTGIYVVASEVNETGDAMSGAVITGDGGNPIPQSCNVNATNIDIGTVDSASITGARGSGAVTVMCVPNTSTVRITAEGIGVGGAVTFDRAASLQGKMTVDGADGADGILALVGPAGGYTQRKLCLPTPARSQFRVENMPVPPW